MLYVCVRDVLDVVFFVCIVVFWLAVFTLTIVR